MIDIREDMPLAPLTTFRIGGPARYFVEVRNQSEIEEALSFAKEQKKPFVILAGGSNVLVPDEGLDAVVVVISGGEYKVSETMLEADAGCNLFSLIKACTEKGIGGWEKMAGIPGTIGGAVRGNAGAFGPEIKDFIISVRALNSRTQETCDFENSECGFSYRQSIFKKKKAWFILRATLELQRVDPEDSKRLIEETIAEREKRHIQDIQASGSFFVNPVVSKDIQEMFEKEKGVKSREHRVPAGWLIEKAGMKGVKAGGAQSSEQQANYLVNTGNATAKDVLELATKIKEAVQAQFGVVLQEEAVILS